MTDTIPDFDLVVLGGGSGGYAAALRAAQLGVTVALVEQDRLGGTCLHQGCVPTKALLHAAEVADTVRDAAAHGITATYEGVDMAGVTKHRDKVVGRLFKGLTGLIASRGVQLVEGQGRLVSPDLVDVDGTLLRGRSVVLATGSYPRTIPGLEVDGVRVLTSDHALQLDRVPSSVIVIGGGVIGCEFASLWRSFGAEVTVIEALPHLLPAEDDEISQQVQRAFRKRKIGVRLSSRLEHVEATADGVQVTVIGADKEVLAAELVLVAVGRGPRSAGLGLEEVGVTLDRGFVVTDEHLRTSLPGVYAVGDIVPGLQLAHRGFQHGMFVAEEIAGLNPKPVVDALVPRVAYCDPEVASVGLTEAAAQETLADVAAVRYDLGGNGKSQILGTQGFVKVVRAGGRVVGVHLVGSRVSELIGEAQLLVGFDVPLNEVASLTHAHPTQNEALGEALMALAGKPLHVHG